MAKNKPTDNSLVKNKKAFHDYAVLETLEAGIVLTGTEVKSCRGNQITMGDAYASVVKGQVWLHKVHISEYKQGNMNNHEPQRTRRLLLHKKEIAKLATAIGEKGLTLVPLGFHLKNGRIKVGLGICKGKSKADKRDTMRKKEVDRSLRQITKQRMHG